MNTSIEQPIAASRPRTALEAYFSEGLGDLVAQHNQTRALNQSAIDALSVAVAAFKKASTQSTDECVSVLNEALEKFAIKTNEIKAEVSALNTEKSTLENKIKAAIKDAADVEIKRIKTISKPPEKTLQYVLYLLLLSFTVQSALMVMLLIFKR
jgi:hypothetical protein